MRWNKIILLICLGIAFILSNNNFIMANVQIGTSPLQGIYANSVDTSTTTTPSPPPPPPPSPTK